MGHVRAVPGEAVVPVTPGSRGAPPGQGGIDSPWGMASMCASQVCAHVCVCRSSQAALPPSSSPGGASRGEKGPIMGEKAQTQWRVLSPEPSCTHGGQGRQGDPPRGEHFCLSAVHLGVWAESNSGLKHRDV